MRLGSTGLLDTRRLPGLLYGTPLVLCAILAQTILIPLHLAGEHHHGGPRDHRDGSPRSVAGADLAHSHVHHDHAQTGAPHSEHPASDHHAEWVTRTSRLDPPTAPAPTTAWIPQIDPVSPWQTVLEPPRPCTSVPRASPGRPRAPPMA